MNSYRALCACIFLMFALLGSPSAGAQEESQKQNAASAKETQLGAWRGTSRVDETGKTHTVLSLAAGHAYETKDGQQKVPDLVLSCHPGNTIAYVDMKHRIRGQNNDSVNLYYSFDAEPPTITTWHLDSEQFVVAPEPHDFIQKLPGKKSLAFEIRPYGRPKIDTYFTLDNLQEVFNHMTERCYQ